MKSHGLSTTPEYNSWVNLTQRCTNENYRNYHGYGGRGITVCDSWRQSFETFLADMGSKPSPKHSIDRIDNSKGYCKENCRWATQQQQCRNTRRNNLITFDGDTKCVSEWAEVTGLSRKNIERRLGLGWSVDRTLTTPVRRD